MELVAFPASRKNYIYKWTGRPPTSNPDFSQVRQQEPKQIMWDGWLAGWAGLAVLPGLGWAGLGQAGPGWLGRAGLDLAELGCAGLAWAGLAVWLVGR